MAAIKSKNTAPELVVRRFLHKSGFRFRLHTPNLPGRPDIVLRRYRAAVFVHGCFWHQHGCANSRLPKTRAAFWRAKLAANRARDKRTAVELRRLGWHVAELWECEITSSALEMMADRIRRWR